MLVTGFEIRWIVLLIKSYILRDKLTYFFSKRRICVSETVGNTALIFATCDSESEFCVKVVSEFFTGVGDPRVKSPNRVVTALVDFNDNGVFSSCTYIEFLLRDRSKEEQTLSDCDG